ncbi:hypothetical protein [Methylococcus sp. EFPC2]|uniref:hypothetical protein n=1 Tax=Methylococcus sp. EFPC2 TaxID=2812648 RepID=UPI001967FA6B|nr:hypothetical protein [Methylococcus sp. EFPC2]QSA97121.1 hypothetical protein JWZ97_18335 [Methylococcus sp. EFPC2]
MADDKLPDFALPEYMTLDALDDGVRRVNEVMKNAFEMDRRVSTVFGSSYLGAGDKVALQDLERNISRAHHSSSALQPLTKPFAKVWREAIKACDAREAAFLLLNYIPPEVPSSIPISREINALIEQIRATYPTDVLHDGIPKYSMGLLEKIATDLGLASSMICTALRDDDVIAGEQAGKATDEAAPDERADRTAAEPSQLLAVPPLREPKNNSDQAWLVYETWRALKGGNPEASPTHGQVHGCLWDEANKPSTDPMKDKRLVETKGQTIYLADGTTMTKESIRRSMNNLRENASGKKRREPTKTA